MGNGWEMGGAARGYGQGAWVVGGKRTGDPRQEDGSTVADDDEKKEED